jgi:hypothetical protein
MHAGHLYHQGALELAAGLAPSMNAKLAFTAISEIPLSGNRAAANSCCKEAPTNALFE